MNSVTVIKSLNQLFTLCGYPSYVLSDCGSSFLSQEGKNYLIRQRVVTCKTTPYHHTCNSQVERYNGIIWKTLCLTLKSANLLDSQWEHVLSNALHSIRSLLTTSTNSTPHERFFGFQHHSSHRISMPSWLMSPGPVLLRRFGHTNDPLVDQVDLQEANLNYVHVRWNLLFPFGTWLPAPAAQLMLAALSLHQYDPRVFSRLLFLIQIRQFHRLLGYPNHILAKHFNALLMK